MRRGMVYTRPRLSAGFKIWKLHMRFSSTVIMAPALSNSPQ